MDKPILFSVIVITYNSAKYILETLDSIRDQDYENLELIISDDCSSDDTLARCGKWLEVNQERFVQARILKAESNQGIPANCNQGLRAATGKWVKFIAGDDAFFPGTFKQAAEFIESNPQARIFGSSSCYFQDVLLPQYVVQTRDDSARPLYSVSAQKQYFLLLRSNYIHAGAVFIQRSLIHEVGGFIEKYNFLEDHPLWLKITRAGEKFYYMPWVTLKYRLHRASVFSHTDTEKLFNNFYKKKRVFELDMIYPYLRWYEKLSFNYVYYVKYYFDLLHINRNTRACYHLYSFLNALAPNAVIHLLKSTKAKKQP